MDGRWERVLIDNPHNTALSSTHIVHGTFFRPDVILRDRTGRERWRTEIPRPSCFAISESLGCVAVGTAHGEIHCLSLSNGDLLHRLTHSEGFWIQALTFDGARLASAASDGTVWVCTPGPESGRWSEHRSG